MLTIENKGVIADEEFLHFLNTAEVKGLQELHTVGVKRARTLYEWRQTNGNFTSVS
jgi:DNA uptake protein ComE-like DNA-binding protein